MSATPTLSFGCARYDRTAPLADGRVGVEGYRIEIRNMGFAAITAASLASPELDIAEVSTSSLLASIDRGARSYVGLPAFLSMCFRHDCIYVRSDSAFERPEDLAGRRIGVPEFFGTTAIWLRGMMQDLHGVDFRRVSWVVGAVEGSAAPPPPQHAEGVHCTYLEPGTCLSDLLVGGKIDAVFAHRVPAAFFAGRLRRLYRDVASAEAAYYRATGHIPLLHLAALKSDRIAADPALPAKLLAALTAAKDLALSDLRETAVYRASLPQLGRAVEEARCLIGDDFWPYGIARNRSSIEAFLRYCHEQGLTRTRLRVEDAFVAP